MQLHLYKIRWMNKRKDNGKIIGNIAPYLKKLISHEEIGKVADWLVKYAGSCAPDSKEALALLIKYIGAEATYEVIGVFILFLILCGVEGSYFLLYWYNKRIIVTWNEIMYRSIWGLERKYSWKDVKSVCYKSTGRGAGRILIRTNKKIYIETGMMKRSEEAERLIKEKGYLQVNLITDRKKG